MQPLQDVDDNLPVLSVSEPTITMQENFVESLPFGTITVVDEDKDLQFSTFEIRAVPNDQSDEDFDESVVIVTPNTGIGSTTVFVRASSSADYFNYENRTEIHFTLLAVDKVL